VDRPERPDSACVLCSPPDDDKEWRRAHVGYLTCDTCYDKLRELLAEIVERYLRLNPRPGAGVDTSDRRPPGFGSRSPANDHVIAHRDPRSSRVARTWRGGDGKLHREPEHPPLSVWGVLDTLAWDVAELRRIQGPIRVGSVPDMAQWIDRHMDWITRHPRVVEWRVSLRELNNQLKPARIKVGVCPRTIDEGEHTTECGAPLFAPSPDATDDTIWCPNYQHCKGKWPRPEWEKLGQLLQNRWLQAA
jgi:hypothetical protein